MKAVRNYFQRITFPGIFLTVFVLFSSAQAPEENTRVYHFNGNVSVTNNGFSLIPSFSLGKPATIAVLSVGGERFSVDPQFRFDLEGLKPWSLIFMWRYKVIQSEKFLFRAGFHLPAIAFREQTIEIDDSPMDRSIPSRFFAPELTTTYMFSERIGAGMYYIFGLGLEKEGQTRHTNFLSFRAYFNRIPMGEQFYFNWTPQFYYLNMDGTDGFFTAQTLELGHRNIPLSLSTMMNIKLKSDIDTKDFDWNIGLVYTFGGQFTRK